MKRIMIRESQNKAKDINNIILQRIGGIMGVKIIKVKESVFKNNNERADKLRSRLKEEKTFLLNLMSSPGSGKTTTLLRTCEILKDKYKIGVMEADIDGSVDAETMKDAGVKAIQVHTGGMCHLDADMTAQGIDELGTDDIDLAILENVGNSTSCLADKDKEFW